MHALAIYLAHVGAWTSLCEFNGPQTIKCLKNLKNLIFFKKKKLYQEYNQSVKQFGSRSRLSCIMPGLN